MKRALFLMLTLFIMVFSFNVTASGNVDAALDVTTLTTEELLNLKEIIDARLIDLGIYPFIALERGDRGEEVERLQGRLMELFYLDGLATARFDSQTQLALKQFERANQLTPDGLASIEDQKLLFSSNAVAKETEAPEAIKNTASLSATATPDPFRSQYQTIDYEEYARFPDEHINKKVYLKGRVEQVLGSRTEGFQIRLSVLKNVKNIVFITITGDPGYNILEGDRLVVYARLAGTVSYQSIWGQTIVIPAAYADMIELQ